MMRLPLLKIAMPAVLAVAAALTVGTVPRADATPSAPALTLHGSWQKLPAAPVSKLPVITVGAWTGRAMIIHGVNFTTAGTRGVTFAYRPATKSWVRLANGPRPASVETTDVAAWTGSRLLVMGLTNGSYNPATNTWRAIARPGMSFGGAVTGWTGRQFLAWGGTCCDSSTRDGIAYNPATNTWRKLPTAPLRARADAAGAWTGRELVVAGGRRLPSKPSTYRDAAAYNPATGNWRKLPQMPTVLPAAGSALWDGKEVLFLSGTSARGLAYRPATNSWRLLPAMPLPRSGFAAVWTGHYALVWGGLSGRFPTWQPPAYGEAYNPATNKWIALPGAPVHGRAYPTSVWTGHQMIVWGGSIPRELTDLTFTDGAAFTPR